MRFLFPAFAFILFSCDGEPSDKGKEKTTERSTGKGGSPQQKASPQEIPPPTRSDRKRTISERILLGSWDPENPGFIISPHTEESFRLIGAIGGDTVTDPAGNKLIVPDFDKSPAKIYPIGQPVPGRPGFVFNPFTKKAVDARGIPPESKIRDPADPHPDHIFVTP